MERLPRKKSRSLLLPCPFVLIWRLRSLLLQHIHHRQHKTLIPKVQCTDHQHRPQCFSECSSQHLTPTDSVYISSLAAGLSVHTLDFRSAVKVASKLRRLQQQKRSHRMQRYKMKTEMLTPRRKKKMMRAWTFSLMNQKQHRSMAAVRCPCSCLCNATLH